MACDTSPSAWYVARCRRGQTKEPVAIFHVGNSLTEQYLEAVTHYAAVFQEDPHDCVISGLRFWKSPYSVDKAFARLCGMSSRKSRRHCPPSDRRSCLRRVDILDAARRHGRGLVTRWPEFLARKPDLHVVLGAVGAFGLLQQLLPETFVDDGRWTDIFSDERLYQTRQVEMLDENRHETATPNGKRP